MIFRGDVLRNIMLKWYDEPVIFEQDHQLIEYIISHNIKVAYGAGPIDFLKPYLTISNDQPTYFGIYIVNNHFNFNELIVNINNLLNTKVNNLYLSINKFLAIPDSYENDLPSNYDEAIYNYVNKHICGTIVNYYSGSNDFGERFNWSHPLTRFWISK